MKTTTLSTLPEQPEPPHLARRYGNLGLIPFGVGALLVWLVPSPTDAHNFAASALAAYASVVVAFLGGIHWGLAMRAGQPGPRSFGWAVVPPLVAWLGTVMPPHAGLVVLGVMLLVCYGVDRRFYVESGLGHWLTLRFRLSSLAALFCFLGAAAFPHS
jgi:hypothetical protein